MPTSQSTTTPTSTRPMNPLEKKVLSYQRRRLLASISLNALILLLLVSGLFFVGTLFEAIHWFSPVVRMGIFFSLALLLAGWSLKYFFVPLLRMAGWLSVPWTVEESSREIGSSSREVRDNLLNAIQLLDHDPESNSLVRAELTSKTSALSPISFNRLVRFKPPRILVRIGAALLVGLLLAFFVFPGTLVPAMSRVLHPMEAFEKPIPFSFEFDPEGFAFVGDPYTIELRITGEAIPKEAFLNLGSRKIKMRASRETTGAFTHTLPNPAEDKHFHFLAAGFASAPGFLRMRHRPQLRELTLNPVYPKHTRIAQKTLPGGSGRIPEGTVVNWQIRTRHADEANIALGDQDTLRLVKNGDQTFVGSRRFMTSGNYAIGLRNEFGKNKDRLEHFMEVTKDSYPRILATFLLDTLLFEQAIIAGAASDDYGISALSIVLEWEGERKRIPVPVGASETRAGFTKIIRLDSLHLPPSTRVSIVVEVTDNDSVNGPKTSFSQTFQVLMPSEKAQQEALREKGEELVDSISKSLQDSENQSRSLEEMSDTIKESKDLGWYQQAQLDELIEHRKNIDERLEHFSDNLKEYTEGQKKHNEMQESLRRKSSQLAQLLQDVLDKETLSLYEELGRLIQQKTSLEKIAEQIEKIKIDETELVNEIDRLMALFSKLKIELELQKLADDFIELGGKQEMLSEKQGEKALEDAQQQEIGDAFSELDKQLDEAISNNKELDRPHSLPAMGETMESIQQDLKQLPSMRDGNQKKKMKQETGKKIGSVGHRIRKALKQGGQKAIEMNIAELEDILDDLIHVSFDQEKILRESLEFALGNARRSEVSRQQMDIGASVEVLSLKLRRLSTQMFQISSFVTQELTALEFRLDKTLDDLKSKNDRMVPVNQRLAMSTMNNLSVMIDDLLQSAELSGEGEPGNGENQQGKPSLPNMKSLQESLSNQIRQLKSGKVPGRSMSEQLAKMAARQEMIRHYMEEFSQQLGSQGRGEMKNALNDAIRKMEQNELDLVNKNITQRLIERQEEITTRMLDAIEAEKEQDEWSEEREGKTAEQYSHRLPASFEKYLKESKRSLSNTRPSR